MSFRRRHAWNTGETCERCGQTRAQVRAALGNASTRGCGGALSSRQGLDGVPVRALSEYTAPNEIPADFVRDPDWKPSYDERRRLRYWDIEVYWASFYVQQQKEQREARDRASV